MGELWGQVSLTSATHPNQPNESYTLDDVGNRTASHQGSSCSYQPFNRLVSANGSVFGYDTNGNQTSKSDASGSWTYSWDNENRLKQATLSGGATVSFDYDALGRRIQATSSTNGITKFIYDGADVVRDIDGSGNTTAEYLNGLELDDKLRTTTGTTALYFLSDHLGTTRTLVDASGISVSALSYDSFGNLLSGSATSRYTYTGRELDSDSSLLFYRMRWYDPKHARFLTEDPIQFSGGLNLYAYVGNYPIGLKDPLGLQAAAAPAPAPAPPAIPPPVAGAGAGAGAGAAAGGSAGVGAAATGGVVVGGFALGWAIGRGIGHIPTGNGKTVDDRVQDWMIDHIWGRPDPAPSTTRVLKCDPNPTPTPRRDRNCTLIAEIPVANNPALKTCVYACKAWRGSTINVVQYADRPCPEEDAFGIIPRPTIPGIWPPP